MGFCFYKNMMGISKTSREKNRAYLFL